MLPRRVVLIVMACAVGLGAIRPAFGAEPTTVALTMTRPADEKKDQQLAENLLTLVELAMQPDKSLAVVERRQIDLLIQELVLNQSRPDSSQLELGKLLTADFLLMLELLPPDKDSPAPWGRLRVVDPKTAAIRGVTVASLDEATLEETAEQFARYVSALVQAPEKPTVTVAVAPFESKGRFDRLRPLELGIRDLVTARLLELSGATSAGPTAPPKMQVPEEASRFQVVQRSNMEQLLRELDLIQSGLSDKSRLPAVLPSRAAAYLVRGEIDERQADDQYTITVRGEMIQAVTQQVAETFQFKCPPAELESQLAAEVDRIGERLWKDEKTARPARLEGAFEVQSLRKLTLDDVRRFRRTDPRTCETPFFHLPGQQPFSGVPRSVEVRTLLGRHLLRKSIDRLESILFLHPGDCEAAYALGYCYSMNDPEIYRPDRADEMLRKASVLGRRTQLEALALDYLSQIDFDDHWGSVIPGREAEAIDRMWFAFVNMPEKFRGRAGLFLRTLGRLHRSPEKNEALAELMTKAAPFAENAPPDRRRLMGLTVQELALQLVRQAGDQPELKEKGLALLQRWTDGEDKELAFWGRKGLAALIADRRDYVAAAAAYEASAALMVDLKTPKERDRHDAQLIEAAKSYRLGGAPARALALLESFEVRFPVDKDVRPANNLLGFHAYEIGCCQEMLDQPAKALATFLHATRINPTITHASDILQHIEGLGGVPLDKDRDVDVTYYPYLPGERAGYGFDRHLATDGKKIYVGDNEGLRAFDVANESWEATSLPPQTVTCIQGVNGKLFAGTKSNGLWQCDVSTGRWQRACPLDKLPDPHVESLALDGHDIYIGVGTRASGGLVRIDGTGEIHVFSEPHAPAVAPTRIVIAKHRVLVCTAETIYEWSMIAETWSHKDPGNLWRSGMPPQLFAGTTAIWTSRRGHELAKWQATDQENAQFRPAWYMPANNVGQVIDYVTGGYDVHFIAQHGDEVWFGGKPWAPFVSSGLYRFRLATGEFHKFSPADGFKSSHVHCVYDSINDGLWLDDRLWLATNEGLCVVTPIKPPSLAGGNRAAGLRPN